MDAVKYTTIATLLIGLGRGNEVILTSREPCTPLFFGQNCTKCHPNPVSMCDLEGNRSYLHMDYRLFLSKDGYQVLGSNIFERAHRNGTKRYSRYGELPANTSELNHFMCSHISRNGEFCGQCKRDHAPSPYTYYGVPCTKCHPSSPGWLYYILLELSFPTVMFLVFLVFRIRITSGYMVALALYCQIIAYIFNTPYFYYLLTEYSIPLTHAVLTLYGVWNMDFFRLIIPRFCVSKNLNTIEVVALGYISAFYPLLLTTVVYTIIKLHHNGCKVIVAIWRPIHKYSVVFQRFLRHDASLVDVFATFLLFSYPKILFVSLEIVHPLKFYQLNYNFLHLNFSTYKSIDPRFDYYSTQHLPFFILAIGNLFVFCIIPPLILCLYPSRCARRAFDRCRLTRSKDFAKLICAFQHSYKNGTNDTRDYRAVSALYATHRVFMFLFLFFLKMHDFIRTEPYLCQSFLYILTFAFYAYARPYKSDCNNMIELLLLLLLIVQSILLFQLYNIGCEIRHFKDCAQNLHALIILQFCILCIPQGGLILSLLWFLSKKLYIQLESRKNAFLYAKYTTLRDYSSLSLDK